LVSIGEDRCFLFDSRIRRETIRMFDEKAKVDNCGKDPRCSFDINGRSAVKIDDFSAYCRQDVENDASRKSQ
jgi:hypothetical protein